MANYLSLSHVYVSTSLSDGGMANSTLEAMSCGLAPIVTDVGDNRLWIEDNKNGYIIPIKSPKILANRIMNLLENEEKRKEFGKKSREKIIKYFNYNNEIKKVIKLYEKLQK